MSAHIIGDRHSRGTTGRDNSSKACCGSSLIAAREPGSFLMLTSLHAGTPRNLPHYSTSKAALAMLVKELTKTLGPFGIRVNALVPGAIAAGGFAADPALARHVPPGPTGKERGPRADGARCVVGPPVRLCHRRRFRGRRQAVAHQLVRLRRQLARRHGPGKPQDAYEPGHLLVVPSWRN
jgi:NAD(P)-dependent dehydrogenase (short-subunit alcohol dehydrogenase family)